MSGLLQQGERGLRRGLERFVVNLAGRSQVAAFSGKDGLVDSTQFLRRLYQVVVDVTPIPVQLVDGPRGNGRLREAPHLGGIGAGVLRQRVARGGELVGWELKEPIDFRFDAA